jgi:hypothetical protein
VSQGGNAVLMVLPAGTVLELPDKQSSDTAGALFVNEIMNHETHEMHEKDPQMGRGVGGSEGRSCMAGDTNGLQAGSLRYSRLETCATTSLPERGGVNGGEVVGVRPPRLTLAKPLRLASPAYILERDLRELELLQRVEELKVENRELRGK